MNYNISSKKFNHPLLKPILEALTTYFSEVDVDFFVIGATARDIIMDIHGQRSGRATQDLDIAIAISDWSQYKIIEEGIINIPDFEKDPDQKQRFIYKENFELDIVPFGDMITKNDKIFWPPNEEFAMSILGFSEVSEDTEKIIIDDDISIEVASLVGVFILKVVAWVERNLKTNKDADDIAFIINNYLTINEQRASEEYYDQIYLEKGFTERSGGATLLGIDTAILLQDYPETKDKIIAIIDSEIKKKDASRLINQILETNSSFKYEETLQCLQNIVVGLKNEQE